MMKTLIKKFFLLVLIGITISPAEWLTSMYLENCKYYGVSVIWKDYDGTILYVVLISTIIFTIWHLAGKLVELDNKNKKES